LAPALCHTPKPLQVRGALPWRTIPAGDRQHSRGRGREEHRSQIVTQATPAQLAGSIRGHWHVETLHHIRDVTRTLATLGPSPP
jgi:hypothetical protein